ncbi:MAG: 30S ribosomal protein S17 [Magnetococcus sp. DMHC-1]|nr:30S ribosomal protein S17 [Magnetococcales bacterium]
MARRVMQGKVVSDKMQQTVVVQVERKIRHPLYGKIVRRNKKYHAHDAENACKIGDVVRIEECRPISKTKCWKVIEQVAGAKVTPDDAAGVP